jgi:oligopeptide/dipeptide ABC transporter ATP-binding protein
MAGLPYHSPVAALLEVRDLAVLYDAAGTPPVHALDEVSLDLDEGEAVALLGESGCGKTTLLLAILGLLPAAAQVVRGQVRFRGEEQLGLAERHRRARRGAQVAMVFQDPSLALNPVRRVGAQVAEVLAAHRDWSRARRREAATAALAEVGLPDPDRLYDAYPHELSGGQRQRVLIAQALVCRPALVLADEPTAALDSTTQAELRALLGGLQRRFGLSLLVATHDLGSAAALARRTVVLYAGRVVETGSAARVFGQPSHPYTRGLLRALPPPPGGAHRVPLVPISGAPPDPARLPPGCAFEPRCPDRTPVCTVRPPREVSLPDGRLVRCFTHGG